MNITWEIFYYSFISLLTGGGLGWVLCATYRDKEPVELEDIQEYMQRVVNAEEADERFNLTRKMLHDANRRTMPRSDSRGPAKVYHMRRRSAPRRRPSADNGRGKS